MTAQQDMVLLGCGDGLFAVPVARVQEILDLCPISRLPHAPPHLLGLIDVRGDSVAVADLRRILGLGPTPDTPATRIIVLWVGLTGQRSVIALKADRVIEVAGLDDGQLGPVPEKRLFHWDNRMIAGIGRRNAEFVTVLDLDRMFGDAAPPTRARVA